MPAYPRASAGRRGPAGPAGPASEWRTSGGFIQTRPVGDTAWTNVVSLADLTSTISAQGFNFKGEVVDAPSLPASGNTAGDAYFITGTADLYVWDGTAWVGPTSLQGPAGNDGDPGNDGADGVGLPVGGTAGQVPVKASATDYDVAWGDVAATGLPEGGTEGDIITYESGAPVWGGSTVGKALVQAADAATARTAIDFTTGADTWASTYLPANGYAPIVVINSGDSPPAGLPDGTLVVEVGSGGGGTAGVEMTVLAPSGDSTDGTTFTTASFTAESGALVLAFVASGMSTSGTTAATLQNTALSGGPVGSWTQAAVQSTNNGFSRHGLWVGVGTGATSTVTITPGASTEACVWTIIQLTGVSTTLVQAASAAPGSTSTTPGVTLSGVSGGNLVVGAIVQQNGNALTPGTGFAEVTTQHTVTNPTLSHAAEWKDVGQNSVTWTGSGTVQRVAIAVEVAPL